MAVVRVAGAVDRHAPGQAGRRRLRVAVRQL
jgi:hypothetical protein